MGDNQFIIITTVYNAEKYIEQCLASIASQTYHRYVAVVIDDCSTDSTWDKIYWFNTPNFITTRNEDRCGSALQNIANAIRDYVTDENSIICLVDGDDMLSRNDVLDELNVVYQNDDVYMTYGQFVPMSGSYGPYCRPIPNTRTYRINKQWYAGHLRTFRKKLWDAVRDEDLRDDDGNYYSAGGDASYLYPMVEICGNRHMRFINKVNYIYNDLNPLNDMKIAVKKQLAVVNKLYNMPPYKEVDTL